MNDKNKVKPRSLKPGVKRLIFTRAVADRKIPREFLANQLIKEIEELGEIPPTFETAKRYISAARNTDSPIDRPWSLGACRDYPQCFPPSSISYLMYYMKNEFLIDGYNDPDYVHKFSIRKAMWMVRLKPFLERFILTSDDDFTISVISEIYTSAELASETMGEEKFDTTELDTYLCNNDLDGILQYDYGAKKRMSKIVARNPKDSKEK